MSMRLYDTQIIYAHFCRFIDFFSCFFFCSLKFLFYVNLTAMFCSNNTLKWRHNILLKRFLFYLNSLFIKAAVVFSLKHPWINVLEMCNENWIKNFLFVYLNFHKISTIHYFNVNFDWYFLKHWPFLWQRMWHNKKFIKLSSFQNFFDRQDFHNLFPLIYFTVEKRRVLNINVKAVCIYSAPHTHCVYLWELCELLKTFPLYDLCDVIQ